MEMNIRFPGGARVDAEFGPYTVRTDQPAPAGAGSAPSPFALFLASIGTCAGIYVLDFCRQRGLATEGLRITQRTEVDRATGALTRLLLDIHVPDSIPEKYHGALVRAAELCKVKQTIAAPPEFAISTTVGV